MQFPARTLWVLAAFCFAGIYAPLYSAVAAADLPDTIDRVRPSIVAVGTAYPARQPIGNRRSNEVRGTGFAVGDGRLIATNDHVIPDELDTDNRQALAVFVGRGNLAQVRPAQVLARDPAHDLALLRIQGAALPPLAFGEDDALREGQTLAFTGFPIGAVLGLYPATHTAIIAARTPLVRAANSARDLTPEQMVRLRRDPVEVFQLDAIAYPGNSGSPVYLPDSGDVIGIINSVFVKESRETVLQNPSGISYAIPVRHLRALLEAHGEGEP